MLSGEPIEFPIITERPALTLKWMPPGDKPLMVEGALTCWKRRSPDLGVRGPTVSVTALLTTEPAEFVTVTENLEPLSTGATAAVVKVAPLLFGVGVPFSLH